MKSWTKYCEFHDIPPEVDIVVHVRTLLNEVEMVRKSGPPVNPLMAELVRLQQAADALQSYHDSMNLCIAQWLLEEGFDPFKAIRESEK